MTKEEAKEFIAQSVKSDVDMALVADAIKTLEQETVLDKIKEDVKEWYWQADKQRLSEDPCVVDAMIDLFIRTIDKYKTKSEKVK